MKPAVVSAVTLLTCLLASCQQRSQPSLASTPNTESTQKNASPIIEIQNLQELSLEPANKLLVWNLRATGVEELAVRLLVIKDGNAHVAQRAGYRWGKWPSGREATWQLYYLLQDGEAFRAKNYRLPSFLIQFDDIAPWSTNYEIDLDFLEGPFVSQVSEARKDNTIEPSCSEVVYYAFYDPKFSLATFGSTVDALVKATKGGRTAVALVLEWKPALASK